MGRGVMDHIQAGRLRSLPGRLPRLGRGWLMGVLLVLAQGEPAAALPGEAPASEYTTEHSIEPGTLLRDGDRWVAIGDSITHGGYYPRYLELYQVTRFPSTKLHAYNAGISGDTAGGVLTRLEWDVLTTSPTVATIMLGMNDVGRDDYASGPDTTEIVARRARMQTEYAAFMRQIVERLRSRGVRVIIIAPTPCDDTAVLDAPALPGVDDGLARLTQSARELAAATACDFIDLHSAMRALNLKAQSSDPKRTLSGGDRVHPDPVGHLAMAHLILEATHAPREVAVVHIEHGQVRTALNCSVSDLRTSDSGVVFTYAANSLPFPMPSYTQGIEDWLPFTERFNREELRVGGLPAGNYRLEIGGKALGDYDEQELACGINLARLGTPQQAQAMAVHDLLVPRWTVMQERMRALAYLEYRLGQKLPRPVTLEDMEPILAAHEKTLRPGDWHTTLLPIYRTDKPRQVEIELELEQTLERARVAARPRPWTVRLTRLTE